MEIKNFTKITLKDVEIVIEGNNLSIIKREYFGGQRIDLSFNELQDIVNAVNGKKIEEETFNAFEGAVKPLTVDVIKRAVKKLKEGGQMYG